MGCNFFLFVDSFNKVILLVNEFVSYFKGRSSLKNKHQNDTSLAHGKLDNLLIYHTQLRKHPKRTKKNDGELFLFYTFSSINRCGWNELLFVWNRVLFFNRRKLEVTMVLFCSLCRCSRSKNSIMRAVLIKNQSCAMRRLGVNYFQIGRVPAIYVSSL